MKNDDQKVDIPNLSRRLTPIRSHDYRSCHLRLLASLDFLGTSVFFDDRIDLASPRRVSPQLGAKRFGIELIYFSTGDRL